MGVRKKAANAEEAISLSSNVIAKDRLCKESFLAQTRYAIVR
jgi:hypothetical protein